MKYHNYVFFTVNKSFYALPNNNKQLIKNEFIKKLKGQEMVINTYTTLGLKSDSVWMLWIQAESVLSIQDFLAGLIKTKLGVFLTITYTLFGMKRDSSYALEKTQDTDYHGGSFLVIYPFTKTHSWYELSHTKRKSLMQGHIKIGRSFPQIKQLLLYSYGVDDHEFIVSYETDDLAGFQDLVMALRQDPVRSFTKSDTPIFTCVYRQIPETIGLL